MTSQINPYNIDGNYPIAGQDNDSQGFRDNFTNLRNNFVFTKNELEDLQNKVILKNPLSGGSVNDVNYNDLNGTKLSNAQMKGVYQTARQLLDVEGVGDLGESLSFKTSNFYRIRTSGKLQLDFADFPKGSIAGWGVMTVMIEVGSSDNDRRVIFGDTLIGINKIRGYRDPSDPDMADDSGLDCIEFEDGEIRIFHIGSYDGSSLFIIDSDGIRLSLNDLYYTEDPTVTDAVDLTTTASYFTTADTTAITMAAGSDGQTKVLAAVDVALGREMEITVTNAAWGGDGTITFTSSGQACTLQYINSKWFCVGNNGAVFA